MKYFLSVVIFFFSFYSEATIVSGRVTDKNKNPIAFASIFLKGTTSGTTSNVDGYYSLDIKLGKHELVFRFIGYKMHVEQIEVGNEKILLDVQLEDEQLKLQEVEIKADAEDPAYAVIRKAIKKRKFYLNQVDAFSNDVYIKGLQRLTKFPKKFMGIEVNGEGQIDTTSGIIYLSESVSKFAYNKGKIHEEMISSKVSGRNNAFSYNRASDMLFNFYENIIEVEDLSDRGFISPISSTAMLSYKYKLLGTFYENGQLINKIQVIPIRKYDPVFEGTVYIAEDSWRIHSVELFLTKKSGIEFVDTLHINQVHLPVDKDIWMPFSNKFTFKFGFMGFYGNGTYVGINSNYVIDPKFPENYFTNEVMKIVEGSNEKDSAYWAGIRPVPLTPEEQRDYVKKDSIREIRESKTYLDSIDKKRNKFKARDLLFGYTRQNSYKKEYFSTSALINNIQYNTVQGWNGSLTFSYTKGGWEERRKRFNISADIGYGFGDKEPWAMISSTFRYKPQKFATAGVRFGRDIKQINDQNPIGGLLNTIYTLLGEENFMKIYRADLVGISHTSELVNGVRFSAVMEYADRTPLLNKSDYKFVDKENSEYTSNNPLDPSHNTYAFFRHQSFNIKGTLKLRYNQQYMTRPKEKIILGSKYPALNISYKKAFKGVLESDTKFDLAEIFVEDDISLKMLGTTSYYVSLGKFLNNKSMALPDYRHFLGNQTLYSPFELKRFNLLPYYDFSTKKEFIEVHAEHNFSGFILNKFPLIRRLKLQEMISFHYMSSDVMPQYMEFAAGVQRLFARVDFVTGYSKKTGALAGFRFGLLF